MEDRRKPILVLTVITAFIALGLTGLVCAGDLEPPAGPGDPGTGRDGTEVPWLAWGTDGQRSILLDTAEGGGIRMTDEEVSMASIKAELAADETITNPEERCRLYVSNVGAAGFDQAEYDSFGPDGCAQFDPGQFRRF